jgi:mannose-6-phosphate isomerase-like protein (cupin superfamily)
VTAPPAAAERFARPPAYYDVWQAGEGIPIHKVFHVSDLASVELGEWKRFGCRAAFVNLADPHITTAIVLEVAAGGETKPVHHLFETLVFVLRGRGETVVGANAVKVAWGERSLFSPPLNATYRHRNTGSGPARLLVVCNAPLVLSLFHSDGFVFGNDFTFDDRFDGRPDFFADPGRHLGGRVWRTNFVPDVLEFSLLRWAQRGAGASSFHISMSDNTMACHISEFEVGTYKKAHRHGPGAHVVILRGEGYSLLWPEGEKRKRVDWKAGSMFSPPEWWYHQHFNTSAQPARYLALRRGGSPEHPLRIGMTGGSEDTGGDQIEYEREDPEIRAEYLRELAAKGIAARMPGSAKEGA